MNRPNGFQAYLTKHTNVKNGVPKMALLVRATVILLTLLLAAGAWAEDGDFMVNIFVNYGSAYRDNAWTPVDVFINNEKRDIKGSVEIRTYSIMGSDRLQSPVYRVSAEIPKNSKKRYRLHCRLGGCGRVEAVVKNGGRPVELVAPYINVTPIRDKDFLCLVLDDKPDYYGFLSTSLFRGTGDVRFYRESLASNRLSFLADYLQCYESFDLIVLGDVDIERIGLEHRELLKRYVARGGSLVACVGTDPGRYRGTWVEELAGVELGTERIVNGVTLASEVFAAPEARQGATRDRESRLVQLLPQRPGVKLLGVDTVLATRSAYGAGHIAVIGVDITTGILEGTAGYLALWRDFSQRSATGQGLHFAEAAEFCANVLPSVAGVELLPMSSVITYLVVYFVVAIVLNYLFWSYMKRREMAWACLVLFSAAFTGYAMFFGTQGRASRTEVEQFEVLQLPKPNADGTPIEGKLTAFTGLLAAGSGRFDAELTLEDGLVMDVAGVDFMQGMRRSPRSGFGGVMGGTRPFNFIEDRPPRIEDLRIGASEMRFIRSEAYVEAAGGVEGVLHVDASGLHGEFVNKTGLRLTKGQLYHQGQTYPLKATPTGWHLAQPRRPGMANPIAPDAYQRHRYGQVPDVNKFMVGFRLHLLFGSPENQDRLSPPPTCIVARKVDGPMGTMALGGRAEENLKGALVFAEVNVTDSADYARDFHLKVAVSDTYGNTLHEWGPLPPNFIVLPAEQMAQHAFAMPCGLPSNVLIDTRDPRIRRGGGTLEVDLWFAPLDLRRLDAELWFKESEGPGKSGRLVDIALGQGDKLFSVSEEATHIIEGDPVHVQGQTLEPPFEAVRHTYRIEDWNQAQGGSSVATMQLRVRPRAGLPPKRRAAADAFLEKAAQYDGPPRARRSRARRQNRGPIYAAVVAVGARYIQDESAQGGPVAWR